MDSRSRAVRAEVQGDVSGRRKKHWPTVARVSSGFPTLLVAQVLWPAPAEGQARIICNEEPTGAHLKIPVEIKKVLSGKLHDPPLQSRDILLVPNNTSRSAPYRGLEAVVSVGTGLAVYRW